MQNAPIAVTDAQLDRLRDDFIKSQPPAVMDVKTLAVVLGVSADTIRDQAAKGKIPCRKLGDRMLFVRDDVLRLFGQLK